MPRSERDTERLATLGALAVFGLTIVLGELGEWLGTRLL
jgi:hypothetical protein